MTRVENNVAFTEKFSHWLRSVGLEEKVATGLAVDTADIVAAAEMVKGLVLSMTEANPALSSEADSALSAAAEIEVQLFTELKSHLETLEHAWPGLLERLDALSEGGLE